MQASLGALPRGRLTVVHTQALVRGGARAPRKPQPPEAFWRSALPDIALRRRINRLGARRSGARRRDHVPADTDSVPVWGELIARGVDENHALGARLGRWLVERDTVTARKVLPPEMFDRDSDDDGEEETESIGTKGPGTPPYANALEVVSAPGRRAEASAHALLDGLLCPPWLRLHSRAPVACSTDGRLRVEGWESIFDEAERSSSSSSELSRHDAAIDLREALGLGEDVVSENATWPELLDIAECASSLGLLPRGDLPEETWRAIFNSPRRASLAVAAAADIGSFAAVEALRPLLRATLSPCVRAANATTDERLRIVALPGFSLLCWATALRLRVGGMPHVGSDDHLSDGPRAFPQVWPAFSECFLVETLRDEAGDAFLRMWQLRDGLELRPQWHQDRGPVPLAQLLERMPQVAVSTPVNRQAENIGAV
eukprot:TRINITY_DN74824_c0_g1_i1.p1 TRINITY_DN74824_c0_g1~~TRINITY_DN74824_c0_g1_i1.p1  ORF type:complete len:450 (-),score=54.65 TRINITY_DN74824_c0_g1_i1:152-1444(-)